MKFHKLNGLGNDFVLFDLTLCRSSAGRKADERKILKHASRIADRHFGVGCDQILLVDRQVRSKTSDFRLRFINADGSVAEMCGNGIRAGMLYWETRAGAKHKSSRSLRRQWRVETFSGVQTVVSSRVGVYTVEMGVPILDRSVAVSGLRFQSVSIGNPHAVAFVRNVDEMDVQEFGPRVERNRAFPHRTNVEFVECVSPAFLRVRVWERGAGETLACGSGACAAFAVAHLQGRVSSRVKVQLPGGILQLRWQGPGTSMQMTGPAEWSWSGEIDL